jgi:hypothetical protein
MMMNKPSLATYYFSQALHVHTEAVKSPAIAARLDFLLQARPSHSSVACCLTV